MGANKNHEHLKKKVIKLTTQFTIYCILRHILAAMFQFINLLSILNKNKINIPLACEYSI